MNAEIVFSNTQIKPTNEWKGRRDINYHMYRHHEKKKEENLYSPESPKGTE